jgi:hypothetical protein
MLSHITEEQVNYTQRSKPFQRNANFSKDKCGYCGMKEYHTREKCPAAKPGILCRNCFGRNHFANVCRNPKDMHKNKQFTVKKHYNGNMKNVNMVFTENENDGEMQLLTESDIVYTLSHTVNSVDGVLPSKLFVILPLSQDGKNFENVKFQIDSAASCNTMPYDVFLRIADKTNLRPSHAVLRKYSGEQIKPIGKF